MYLAVGTCLIIIVYHILVYYSIILGAISIYRQVRIMLIFSTSLILVYREVFDIITRQLVIILWVIGAG